MYNTSLIVKSIENIGYNNFLNISEMLSTPCDYCKKLHGNLFLAKDFEEGLVSLPGHKNCKCSLVALDKEDEKAYAFDKDNFLEWILKNIDQHSCRIYRLKNGKILPVVEKTMIKRVAVKHKINGTNDLRIGQKSLEMMQKQHRSQL